MARPHKKDSIFSDEKAKKDVVSNLRMDRNIYMWYTEVAKKLNVSVSEAMRRVLYKTAYQFMEDSLLEIDVSRDSVNKAAKKL